MPIALWEKRSSANPKIVMIGSIKKVIINVEFITISAKHTNRMLEKIAKRGMIHAPMYAKIRSAVIRFLVFMCFSFSMSLLGSVLYYSILLYHAFVYLSTNILCRVILTWVWEFCKKHPFWKMPCNLLIDLRILHTPAPSTTSWSPFLSEEGFVCAAVFF